MAPAEFKLPVALTMVVALTHAPVDLVDVNAHPIDIQSCLVKSHTHRCRTCVDRSLTKVVPLQCREVLRELHLSSGTSTGQVMGYYYYERRLRSYVACEKDPRN